MENLSGWLLVEKCSGGGSLNFKLGGYVEFFGGNAVGFVVAIRLFGRLTLGSATVVQWLLRVVPALSKWGAIVYVVFA